MLRWVIDSLRATAWRAADARTSGQVIACSRSLWCLQRERVPRGPPSTLYSLSESQRRDEIGHYVGKIGPLVRKEGLYCGGPLGALVSLPIASLTIAIGLVFCLANEVGVSTKT